MLVAVGINGFLCHKTRNYKSEIEAAEEVTRCLHSLLYLEGQGARVLFVNQPRSAGVYGNRICCSHKSGLPS